MRFDIRKLIKPITYDFLKRVTAGVVFYALLDCIWYRDAETAANILLLVLIWFEINKEYRV